MSRACVDLFAGAGGMSTGLLQAAEGLGLTLNLTAINHWKTAVNSHALNHPMVTHHCEDVEKISVRQVVPGGRVRALVMSPECIYFSSARGGGVCNDQSRAGAWQAVRWASDVRVDDILLENVREFQNWGPLNKNGKPCKRKKTQTFQAFVRALEAMGYGVDHRVINCADYGDPQSRMRFFLRARLNGRPTWPEPSHAGAHRPARDIVDALLHGTSIYGRKKPLALNTRMRILKGLLKLGIRPYIIQTDQTGSNGGCIQSTEDPLKTVVSKQNAAFVEPFLVRLKGSTESHLDGSSKSLDDSLPALQAKGNHLALVEPFILSQHATGAPRSLDDPMPTVMSTSRGIMLVEPMLLGQQSDAQARPLSQPAPTVSGAGAIALIEPFLVKYYGTGVSASLSDPLDMVTSKARFGLVQPVIEVDGQRYILEILFRMLQPHELAAAMSFPKGYHLTGTKEDQVKQIGNAVPVCTARALCREMLSRST